MDKNQNLKNEIKLRISLLSIDDDTSSSKHYFIRKKSIIAACTILTLSTGVVFAQDINNYIKKIFNNSSQAINTAIEEGYLQNTNMNYTYDKNIGIKVEHLFLDNLNLNISFNFKTEKKNIKSIRFNDFIITTNSKKVVYRSEFIKETNFEDLPLYHSIDWMNESIQLDNSTFSDSILIGLKNDYPKFSELHFEIKSLNVTYEDNTHEIINGNWIFYTEVDDNMQKDNSIIYSIKENNNFIEFCEATMSPSGMIIELKTKKNIPTDIFIHRLVYIKSNDTIYYSDYIDFNERNMKIHFNNIGKSSNSPKEFELYLDFFETIIKLVTNNI